MAIENMVYHVFMPTSFFMLTIASYRLLLRRVKRKSACVSIFLVLSLGSDENPEESARRSDGP